MSDGLMKLCGWALTVLAILLREPTLRTCFFVITPTKGVSS
jgi:hypothetical protein